jgi:two-component system NtrC family sensor kinase
VRNPLNAIQAATAALELDYGKGPDARELFDIVHSQVGRLAQLMRDLLVIGKPVDQMSMQRRRVAEIVREGVALWRAGRRPANRDCVRLEGDSQLEVLVDSTRMQQVLINLLDNALQHGGEGTNVVISIEDRADGCCICVRDSGRGVKADDADRIFEPFYTTRRGGTGLGLALVKSIVQRHGGSVALRNNHPDRGCTFEMVLPAAPAKEDAHGSETVDRR